MTDFEALYQRDPDPWAVRTSWYERRKRAVLMAALPRERYRNALELGCGTGETTRLLAPRCDTLHAVDLSDTAAQQCRQRLAQDRAANARVQVLRLPAAWPVQAEACTGLIVASELAYYFSDEELEIFIDRCVRTLAPGGDWAMCHYKPDFHDRRQSTERMHGRMDAIPGLCRVVAHDDERFRLDIWRKRRGAGS